MDTADLRSKLHQTIDQIQEEQILGTIYSFLNEKENSEAGKMWISLTEEQTNEILRLYDESRDDV